MHFGQKNGDDAVARTEEERMRAIERQFSWTAQDWHWKLLKVIPSAYLVHAWFGSSRFVNGKLYFDGSTPRGSLCYDYVRGHYLREVAAALGQVEYCLASRGAIIKSYTDTSPKSTALGEKHGE